MAAKVTRDANPNPKEGKDMERKVEQVVFLRGRKTILRPINKNTDFEKCWRWINDQEVRQYLKVYLPVSLAEEEKWINQLGNNEHNMLLAIETLEGEHIGNMGLHRISWKDGTAVTGALIGEKKYWGKGYGTDAKMSLLNYAFNSLNLRKICSNVYAFNQRSVAYSLRCGYQIEGRLKKHIFKNGRFHDQVMLAVFKEDWLPLWRKYKKTGKLK